MAPSIGAPASNILRGTVLLALSDLPTTCCRPVSGCAILSCEQQDQRYVVVIPVFHESFFGTHRVINRSFAELGAGRLDAYS
jgi:hypothetical protein